MKIMRNSVDDERDSTIVYANLRYSPLRIRDCTAMMDAWVALSGIVGRTNVGANREVG
jgi:hypothetical protein